MEPMLSEIRLFAFGYAPGGWLECDGRAVPILAYQPLFALLGWRFGGDGWTTFALPDLRGQTRPELVPAIAFCGVLARGGERHG